MVTLLFVNVLCVALGFYDPKIFAGIWFGIAIGMAGAELTRILDRPKPKPHA